MPKSLPTAAPPNLRFVWSHPAHAISLSAGLGLAPTWPGTVGAAGGVLLALPLLALPGPAIVLVLAATFALGVWAATITGRALGEEDASEIVFDETWAMAATLVAVPADPLLWIAAFVAFRFFDIVKPQPIRLVQDRVRGGLGVMADDLAAAIAAAAVVDAAALVLGRW